jgi:pimeloyl-ACP methyl ester carboxylesterase
VDLYYGRRGGGAPLLLITGGGGDCGYYAAAADILAGDYTVLTYDRRGNSRSRLAGDPAPITMGQQSADAVAVLRACGFSSAVVFGNSGGAQHRRTAGGGVRRVSRRASRPGGDPRRVRGPAAVAASAARCPGEPVITGPMVHRAG